MNHLANRLVTTLFIPNRPFFKLDVQASTAQMAQEELGITPSQLESLLSMTEQHIMSSIDMASHRTEAVNAVKNVIIVGNAAIHYSESKSKVIPFQNYVWKRNAQGEVVEYIQEDSITLDELPDDVKTALKEQGKGKKDDDTVKLYTQYKRKYTDDSYTWKVRQEVHGIDIDLTSGVNPQYLPDELPYVFLTWNLVTGEDYGRGLIEDYSYAFHAHEVISSAGMRLMAVTSDVKFFVEPGAFPSAADLANIVQSPSGTYHELPKESIWTPTLPVQNLTVFEEKVRAIERDLAQAFLLNSSAVRDAERVTAEEIRMQVQELETSYGGIYSRFSTEWQAPLAKLLFKENNATPLLSLDGVNLKIITGLESISRLGEMENIRQLLLDMANIGAMPPTVLERLKLSDLWILFSALRGLDSSKFVKSDEEFRAEQQAMQQQAEESQSRMMQQEAITQAAASATTATQGVE